MTPEGQLPRRELEDRVRFLSAITRALDERPAVLDVLDRAPTRDAALLDLSKRFGWDALEARVVLDVQLGACTQDRRSALAKDLAEAIQALRTADR